MKAEFIVNLAGLFAEDEEPDAREQFRDHRDASMT